MSDDGSTDVFEAERPRLLGLAYRMLGSLADAEDVVQDAWLRWEAADRTVVDNAAAWLTTVATRIAIDRLRALTRRREDYVGPWLPEPVALASPSSDPEAVLELAETMTLGFLVVLDSLSPAERAVFLLAEVFGEPYAAIAEAVGKTEDNCRQIASRARRKVRDARPPELDASTPELLKQLLTATAAGDIDTLLELLDADVVLVSDGGAERRAARVPMIGADRVARYLIGFARRVGRVGMEFLQVNGAPAVRIDVPDGAFVMDADTRDGKVIAVRTYQNPGKITHLDDPIPLR